jgi:hypothetical protein
MAGMPAMQEQLPAMAMDGRYAGPLAFPTPADTSHIPVGRNAGAIAGDAMDGRYAGPLAFPTPADTSHIPVGRNAGAIAGDASRLPGRIADMRVPCRDRSGCKDLPARIGLLESASNSSLGSDPAMHYDEILAHRAQSCTLQYLASAPGEEPAKAAMLAEVSDRLAREGFEQFSMLFSVAESGAPRQGTYAVTFADATAWEIFLVPVRRQGADVFYEACFNRDVADAAA